MTEVTEIKLVFECKDSVLAASYEEKFGERFRSEMAYFLQAGADIISWENLAIKWNVEMMAEAVSQEHHDYYVDEEGRHDVPGTRHVLYDQADFEKGIRTHLYLVPTIRVEPVANEVTVP